MPEGAILGIVWSLTRHGVEIVVEVGPTREARVPEARVGAGSWCLVPKHGWAVGAPAVGTGQGTGTTLIKDRYHHPFIIHRRIYYRSSDLL